MFQDYIKTFLLVLSFTFFSTFAFAKDYQEGRHYQLIEPIPTRNPEKVEVIEFFWFGCGHCFSLEQLIDDWKGNADEKVDFFRLPVIWNAQTKTHAKLFFATETLKVPEAIEGIFSAIHFNRKMMLSDKEVVPFFQGYGVEEAQYLAAVNLSLIHI